MPKTPRRTLSSLSHVPWQKDKTPFRLADLAPEIRILIFEEYMKWRIIKDKKLRKISSKYMPKTTPTLIKALRPVPALYLEAVEIYYNLSTLSCSKYNEARVKILPREVTERARSLELWYGVRIKSQSWELEIAPCFPIDHLFRFYNVRRVYITTTAESKAMKTRFTKAIMRNIVKQALIQLPNLQVSTLEMPTQYTHNNETLLPDDPIGITPQMSSPLRATNVAYTWDAGRDHTLTWTDDTHWRSIPWENTNALYVAITGFHRLSFWMPIRLQFLGMNPRPLILSCVTDTCNCATPGQDWYLNP